MKGQPWCFGTQLAACVVERGASSRVTAQQGILMDRATSSWADLRTPKRPVEQATDVGAVPGVAQNGTRWQPLGRHFASPSDQPADAARTSGTIVLVMLSSSARLACHRFTEFYVQS